MAAAPYDDSVDSQHLLSSHRQHESLKPMLVLESRGEHAGALFNHHSDEIEYAKDVMREDEHLKYQIRLLRLVSRVVALLISIAVFIPIAMTLYKFLMTQNTYRDVQQANGMIIRRTAWAEDTKVWPTFMYFAVATTAVVLNLTIVLSYLRSVQQANQVATVATTFTWIVLIGHLAIWSVAAALYRQQKNLSGKSNDLWGWTCSAGAQEIQHAFKTQINFDQYCTTQSISWYIGLVQVGAAILTVIIYILTLKRRKTKKIVQRESKMIQTYQLYRR